MILTGGEKIAQWVMPKKAAEATRVSIQTLRTWAKAGTIPYNCIKKILYLNRFYYVKRICDKMETKYYVCVENIGIDKFDNSSDQMTSISATKDKNKWIKFTFEEAEEVKRQTGWNILKCQ